MITDPFPLIEISGAPRERGRQYGEQSAERIARGIKIYRRRLEVRGKDWLKVCNYAENFSTFLDQSVPECMEEMKGIAEGAGVDIAHVLVLNARTELMYGHQTTAESFPNDGCTAIVVLPERSSDGCLLHGQNWDWIADCVDTGVVLRIRPDYGPDILTFAEAGQLARCGFNANGVSISGNFLESDADMRAQGWALPLAIIRRLALEASNYHDSLKAVFQSSKMFSNNMVVSHMDGESYSLEATPEEVFWVEPENGLLVHANHFQSLSAQCKIRDTGIPDSPDSLYRLRRTRNALESLEKISIEDLKTAFKDDFGTPYSVCRPPIPGRYGDRGSASVATIIMKPSKGLMWIAPAPWEKGEFTQYSINASADISATV